MRLLALLLAAGVTLAAGDARAGATDPVELAFWDSIANSKNPAEYRAYLETFPNGRFAPLARLRAGVAAPPAAAQPPTASTPSASAPAAPPLAAAPPAAAPTPAARATPVPLQAAPAPPQAAPAPPQSAGAAPGGVVETAGVAPLLRGVWSPDCAKPAVWFDETSRYLFHNGLTDAIAKSVQRPGEVDVHFVVKHEGKDVSFVDTYVIESDGLRHVRAVLGGVAMTVTGSPYRRCPAPPQATAAASGSGETPGVAPNLRGVWGADCAEPRVRFDQGSRHVFATGQSIPIIKTAHRPGQFDLHYLLEADGRKLPLMDTYAVHGDMIRIVQTFHNGAAVRTWNWPAHRRCNTPP